MTTILDSYDTALGIQRYLLDLEGLNQLAKLRHEAGYVHKERLNEWCILGRFYLDSCGNCGPIIENIPAEMYRVNPYDADSHVPRIMSKHDLNLFMRGETFSWSSGTAFPPHYAKCEVCLEPWTIDNCHDMIQGETSGFVDISPFAGKEIGVIRKIPNLIGKTSHYVGHEIIHNPAYQGETKQGTNGIPWRRISKDYVVEEGDQASVHIFNFTHEACYRRNLATTNRKEMIEVFTRAGYPNVNLITIPNEYHGEDKGRKRPYYATPWYLVQVDDGPVFKVGWRKSVINIDWEDTGKRLPNLFAQEDTTQGDCLVHAHGYEKATEYLKKLIPALGE